jgi:hypothetical protein
MAFPPDRSDRAALLHGDARESVRVLALGYLDRTADGSRALRDAPDDPESVHALRVALTRLRGTIRAGAEGLAPTRSARADRPEGVASGAVRAVLGRRTASVLRATHRSLGVVRDLDVQAAALRALAVEEVGGGARAGRAIGDAPTGGAAGGVGTCARPARTTPRAVPRATAALCGRARRGRTGARAHARPGPL